MKSKQFLLTAVAMLTALPVFAVTPVTVMPVPWIPTNPTSPHSVVTGTTATLAATVNLGGSGDSFTYSWNYGDGTGSSTAVSITTSGSGATVGNVYNLSTTHVYPATTGTAYTAVITVTDTTTSATYTGNYYLIVEPNTLAAQVDQAIDGGLWYLHTTEERGSTTDPNSNTVQYGSWDNDIQGCDGYACSYSVGGLNATNVQAFEVSGHYENGPSTDPYTDDVARGLARMMQYLAPYSITNAGDKVIYYDPSLMASRCSDGSLPLTYGNPGTCSGGATYINYNPGATTCTSPPCDFSAGPLANTFDGNANGQILIPSDDDPGYQTGMYVTAIVAGQNPTGTAKLGATAGGGMPGVFGRTYLNIVQDLIDGIGYCQYYGDEENSDGKDNGGGWEYYCAGTSDDGGYYDDNSPSQWNAIAMIAANRGFGITIPQIVKDLNQVWTTWDQCIGSTCTGYGGDYSTALTPGAFGYDAWDDPLWGPWAVTPSGMVQMAMDGIGRTASGATDQRWNISENYYRNSFCSSGTDFTTNPKLYTYGLFSFTKAMEQHAPGGVLTPITYLSNQPGSTNGFDWYGAQASAGAPCDGVAQTLVNRQSGTGYWYGVDGTGAQYPFETAWSTIMLQKTSFVACVNNLAGQGKASSRSSGAAVTLTWSSIPSASTYEVLRSTSAQGPFAEVGSPTAKTAFVDQTAGLVNGDTYYYELQPLNGGGSAVCTSNQAVITVP